jgi:hypothetical protein
MHPNADCRQLGKVYYVKVRGIFDLHGILGRAGIIYTANTHPSFLGSIAENRLQIKA